jgi:hypothetical protein
MADEKNKWSLEEHRRRVLKHGSWAGHYSYTGYLPNSPDRHRAYNVIPANRLTMRTVPHDILAVASTGQVQLMKADAPHHYLFPGASWVHETPLRQPNLSSKPDS